MTFVFTVGELIALSSIPALLLAFHGVSLRLLAGAVCSLLIPALVVGAVHVPPEVQITKARARSVCRRGSEQ